MKIVNLIAKSAFTDGFSYQENILPKYHNRMKGASASIVTSPYSMNPENGNRHFLNIRARYTNGDGVDVVPLTPRFSNMLPERLGLFTNVLDVLEQEAPDVLFVHLCQSFALLDVVKYKKRHPDVRVICDSHADYSNSGRGFISKNILHKVIWKSVLRYANPYIDFFWGVLPARVEFLRKTYGLPEDKCGVLVMGADDDLVPNGEKSVAMRAAVRLKYGIPEDAALVVTGGKIDLEKTQVIELMKAVASMQDEGVYLLLFGSVVDELEEEFSTVLSSSENIAYAGWLKSEDSYGLFNAADLVCFPGRHSVFWEQAIAQGKPLLVKKWDGYGHIEKGKNVAYTSGDSRDCMKNDLHAVLDKSRLSQMTEAAKEASSHFMYSRIAGQSIDVGFGFADKQAKNSGVEPKW